MSYQTGKSLEDRVCSVSLFKRQPDLSYGDRITYFCTEDGFGEQEAFLAYPAARSASKMRVRTDFPWVDVLILGMRQRKQ